MTRRWLEQVEASASGDDALAVLAWLAGAELPVEEDEAHGAVRRAMLLLAAGGDPNRPLELDGRAVGALAAELDRPERRAALGRRLEALLAEADGLPRTQAALDALVADADLAWRAYAAGLLGEELAGE
jgi:hypothetical protein